LPVLKFDANRLIEITGVDINTLQEALFSLKCETSISNDNILEVEINPDRPDMYIGEGIGRAVRGIMNLELGYKEINTENNEFVLINEQPNIRPYIAGAIVSNLDLSSYISELIQFQEKLHDGIGRKRRKIAIGIHDLNKVPSKELKYKYININNAEMVPLGYNKRLKVKDLLKTTEQGIKYGNISLKDELHPAFLSGDEIISLPPVINSDITRLEPDTKNILIDITGTDEFYVDKTLDIIISNLSEIKGSKVKKIKIKNANYEKETPLLKKENISLEKEYVNKILGTSLSIEEINYHLQRMRFDSKIINDKEMIVIIPPYRIDIIQKVDLTEEIAMAIGYNDIIPNKPKLLIKGEISNATKLKRKIRDIMIGLGFTELLSLTLVSSNKLRNLDIFNNIIISNPVQEDYDSLRPSLFISMINAMAYNERSDKPVKLFEIGKTVEKANKIKEREKLAISIMDESLSYEDIQAIVYSLLKNLNVNFKVKKFDCNLMTNGRSAGIEVNNTLIGCMGEVNPYILQKFNLDYPVVFSEIDLGELVGNTR
jgi:phenylalanyl-tRNA synthetase beta chain